MVSTFYACALALCLTADGTRIDWKHDRPRIVAVRADSGLFRQDVCVTFPGGSKITYHAIDICPSCRPGQVDILVRTRAQAVRLGVMKIELDKGRCP